MTKELSRSTFRAACLACAVLLFAGYTAMFLSYRPYEIDSTWFLSFSYGFWHGIPTDQFMNVRFPAGQDGTILFGKIAAFVQGCLGELFHWQQFPFVVLNSVLMLLWLACWTYALRRSGAGRRASLAFLVALGVAEPAVSTVERFRYEAVGCTLSAVGLALIAADFPFAGLLLAMVATETQPIAVLGIIPALWFAWTRRRSTRRFCVQTMIAGLLAFGLYLLLHPQVFQVLHALRDLKAAQEASSPGVLLYFFKARHLPEVALFAIVPVAITIQWFRTKSLPYARGLHWLAGSGTLALLVGFFIKHANPAYIVYVYPMLVAMLVLLWDSERWQWSVPTVFCVLFVTQYLVLVRLNWGYGHRARDIAQVQKDLREAAQAIGKPVDDLEITGDYSLWYAHPSRYLANTWWTEKFFPKSDLLMCFDGPLSSTYPAKMPACGDYVRLHPQLRLLRTDMVRGKRLSIFWNPPVGR